MFWIAFLGLAFSSMLIKLGLLSATASILAFVVKLLLFVIVAGLMLHNHVALNRNLAPRVGLFVNRNPDARIALDVLPDDRW